MASQEAAELAVTERANLHFDGLVSVASTYTL